jgi:hypothetical protein
MRCASCSQPMRLLLCSMRRPISLLFWEEFDRPQFRGSAFVCLSPGWVEEVSGCWRLSGRSCIIGPAVASSSSLRPLSRNQAQREPSLNFAHRRPIHSGAAQIFPRPCVPCHSRRPVKTLSLRVSQPASPTRPARDQLFVNGEESGGFSRLAQKNRH